MLRLLLWKTLNDLLLMLLVLMMLLMLMLVQWTRTRTTRQLAECGGVLGGV